MRVHLGLVLSLAIAGAAFADGETDSLPAGDLLRRKGPSNREVRAVATHPAVEGHARKIAGEDGLMATALDEGAPPWFDSQTLCGAIDEMLGPEAKRTQYDEKSGNVVFDRADRAKVTQALAELRSRAPQPIAVTVSLSRLTGREGITGPEQLLSAEGYADVARTLVIADAVERQVVADYDVEVAQASSIGDPILAILRTGVSAAICVTPMPDGRSALLETVTRAARPVHSSAIDLGNAGFGTLDRCAVRFDEVGACVRIENGRRSTIEWTGREGTRLILSVEATWTPPPPPGEPAVVVSPLFRSGFWGFLNVPSRDLPREEATDAWGVLEQRVPSAEALMARAFDDPLYSVSAKWNGSVLVLPGSPPKTAREQHERFCAVANEFLKSAHVDCLVLNVAAGAAAAFDAVPPGAITVAGFSGQAVLGLPVCSTGGTERRYLADWDVEVAQSSRIADPQIMGVASGHFLNLTPREGSVDVDLDLRRLDAITRQTLPLAVGRSSQGVQGDKSNGPLTDPMLPSETVAVEKPVVAQMRVASAIPLGADGTGSLRRSGRELAGEGREIVVLVRVR